MRARAGRHGQRVLARLVTVLLPALGVLWLSAGPAAAHATLASTVPAADAVVAVAPATVRLSFNEAVRPVGAAFVLYDSQGEVSSDGAPARLGVSGLDTVVTVTLPPSLPQGSYLLGWRVVSEDSHPVSGVLGFSVGEVSAAPLEAPGDPDSSASPTTIAFLVLTVAGYLSLFTAVGLRVFDLVRRAPADRVARRLVATGLVLATAAAGLLVGVTELREQGDPLGDLVLPRTWVEGLGAPAAWGLALTVAAAVLLSLRLSGRPAHVAVVVGAALAAASVLPTGHTRTVAPVWLMASLALVHALAAAVWLGGVVGLGLHLRRAKREQADPAAAAAVVVRFSALAGLLVALLGASGVVMALLVLGGDARGLLTTAYGRAVAMKIGVVGVVALLALANKLFLVPAVDRAPGVAAQWRRLRAAVLDEAVLLVVVLAVTGVLTQQSPSGASAGEVDRPAATAGSVGEPGSAARRAPLGSGSLQGRLEPAIAGPNAFEFTVRDVDGAPAQPVELPTVQASLPGAQLRSLPARVTSLPGVGHYRAELTLPVGGEWRILVSVRLGRFDEPTTTLVVPVSG